MALVARMAMRIEHGTCVGKETTATELVQSVHGVENDNFKNMV